MFEHWYYLLIILAIVLLIFGPGKLGDVGGALGKSIREFRKSSHGEDESTQQP
jgi:sec-independent protein translocase protein TatA